MKKVYVNLKDNLPVNVDIQNAIDGFEYFGYKIVGYTLEDVLSGKLNRMATENIFVGSIDSMTGIFKNINRLPEPIDFPDSIIKSGLLNREIKKTTLENFANKFKEDNIPMFVKPVNTKLFSGILVSNENHLSYLKGYDCEVLTSEKIDILSEHRVYVHKKEMIYSCNYSGDFRISPDFDYVQKLIYSYDNQPIAYTLDVGILKNGVNTLIEANDFWAIGSYGLYSINYAEMLKDRYEEIVKI